MILAGQFRSLWLITGGVLVLVLLLFMIESAASVQIISTENAKGGHHKSRSIHNAVDYDTFTSNSVLNCSHSTKEDNKLFICHCEPQKQCLKLYVNINGWNGHKVHKDDYIAGYSINSSAYMDCDCNITPYPIPSSTPTTFIPSPEADTPSPEAEIPSPDEVNTPSPEAEIPSPSPEADTPSPEAEIPSPDEVNTPSPEAEIPSPSPEADTPSPEAEIPSPDEVNTPSPEAEIPSPSPEADTPSPETEIPSPEADTPSPEAEIPNPSPEVDIPSPEADTPSPEASIPSPDEVDTPSPEVDIPSPFTSNSVLNCSHSTKEDNKLFICHCEPQKQCLKLYVNINGWNGHKVHKDDYIAGYSINSSAYMDCDCNITPYPIPSSTPTTFIPSPEADTPSAETEIPSPEADTPSPEAEIPNPSPEVDTPSPEADTPSPKAAIPSPDEVDTPSPEAAIPSPMTAPSTHLVCDASNTTIVRDFRGNYVDMQTKITGVKVGFVQPLLGPYGIPVSSEMGGPNVTAWYDNTTSNVIIAAADMDPFSFTTLTLDSANNLRRIRFCRPSGFFPIDGLGFGNENRTHNYHFTIHMRLWVKWILNANQSIQMESDDDGFVFVNHQLAIDLGGIHPRAVKSVNLDAFLSSLTNSSGGWFPLDIFFAERHVTQSAFCIDTWVELYQCEPVLPIPTSMGSPIGITSTPSETPSIAAASPTLVPSPIAPSPILVPSSAETPTGEEEEEVPSAAETPTTIVVPSPIVVPPTPSGTPSGEEVPSSSGTPTATVPSPIVVPSPSNGTPTVEGVPSSSIDTPSGEEVPSSIGETPSPIVVPPTPSGTPTAEEVPSSSDTPTATVPSPIVVPSSAETPTGEQEEVPSAATVPSPIVVPPTPSGTPTVEEVPPVETPAVAVPSPILLVVPSPIGTPTVVDEVPSPMYVPSIGTPSVGTPIEISSPIGVPSTETSSSPPPLNVPSSSVSPTSILSPSSDSVPPIVGTPVIVIPPADNIRSEDQPPASGIINTLDDTSLLILTTAIIVFIWLCACCFIIIMAVSRRRKRRRKANQTNTENYCETLAWAFCCCGLCYAGDNKKNS